MKRNTMKNQIRVFLYLISIIISQVGSLSPEICESCKRMEECSQFGDMTNEQQQQWIQDFPCEAPESAAGNPRPGFSAVAKGDFVCCPSPQVWGIKKDDTGSSQVAQDNEGGTNKHSFYVPKYLWYQNEPSSTYNPLYYGQPRTPNNPQNIFYEKNNYGNNAQCLPQSSPPTPESGCCGVDMSDADRITDVQEFLRLKAPSSNFGSQYNTPRYPMYKRAKRDADFDALGLTFDDRIAGGRETALDQYPWTALLSIHFVKRSQMANFACGGSLISSRFILTAAHCMVNDDFKLNNIDVTLAEYDKRSFPRDCMTVRGRNPVCVNNLKIDVKDVIIHQNFNEEFLINDIALLRLRDIAPYTRFIRPICLPPINIDRKEFSNLPLATTGWGLNVSVKSDIKQFTIVHMVPKNQCQLHYTRLTEGHLCASGKKKEDTCKGDSGGPLMMMYKGKYHLVGIVSGKTSAYNCGTPVPSLYTNVYTYLDWIRYYVR